MSLSKSLTGYIAAFVLIILVPHPAQACYCAQKPDGGYLCETHCTPPEIDNLIGTNHGPVQMVSNVLTGNFFPPNTAPGKIMDCYTSATGDYVCAQSSSGTPSSAAQINAGTSMPKTETTNSAAGAVIKPVPGQTQPLSSPSGLPFNIGTTKAAYQWPPGFGCESETGMTSPPPVGQSSADWQMTFNDEFNAFNPGVWNDAIWYETSNLTKNYTVENGVLKIWPQRDQSGNFFNRTIDTDGKFSQTYGYFEMEAKLNVGKGVWPAFWLFNHIGDRRPEIDIMEAYPGGGPGGGWGDSNFHPVAFASTIWPDADQQAGHKTLNTEDLAEKFHTYALQWEPDRQIYYFDGKPFYEADISMNDPMYIMLDLWFGSASGQPGNSTPQGRNNAYEINYVRAWENCNRDSKDVNIQEAAASSEPQAVASCTPQSEAAPASDTPEVEESFDGALTSLGDTLMKTRHVEPARGMGVNGSDAIKVSYVGSSEGSDRVTARYHLTPAMEYTLSFDVNFCPGFDFVKGGKLHGLGPESPITGGNSVPDDGWSARGMFRTGGHLESYVYSQNMKGKYGEGILTDSFAFEPGRYYSISYQVGLNDPASASNGYMKVFVDGMEVINHQGIKFRDTDAAKSLISTLMFNTFHGGHTSDWAPKNADGSYAIDCAYYDNFAAYAAPRIRKAPVCIAESKQVINGTQASEIKAANLNGVPLL